MQGLCARAAFYKWLQQEYCANAVLHFGMHGTVEWLPGAPLGDSHWISFLHLYKPCHVPPVGWIFFPGGTPHMIFCVSLGHRVTSLQTGFDRTPPRRQFRVLVERCAPG